MWFIISAGLAGVPFSKFYLYTLPVTVFQFGGLMVLGYFLGATMWYTTNTVLLGLQIAIAAIAVFVLIRAGTQIVRKKLVERKNPEPNEP